MERAKDGATELPTLSRKNRDVKDLEHNKASLLQKTN